MSKKKKTLVAVFAVLGIAALGLAGVVYAKYIASFTAKGGNAVVAKWAFEADNKTTTVTCDPAKTYDSDKLFEGKIAPGTAGSCSFKLTNTNSEVGVKYTIKLSSDTTSGENKPANLELKYDGSAFPESGITGTLKAKDATGKTVTIDWEWPYEGTATDYDAKDTADGTNPKTMVFKFDISGVQVEPTE